MHLQSYDMCGNNSGLPVCMLTICFWTVKNSLSLLHLKIFYQALLYVWGWRGDHAICSVHLPVWELG